MPFLLLALGATACSAEPDGEPRIPTDPRLSMNPAPAGMSFATTRAVGFRLEPADVTLSGQVVQLRIGLEPTVSDPVYVGRVWPDRPVDLRLSVPTAAAVLYYELSDETGASQHEEISP